MNLEGISGGMVYTVQVGQRGQNGDVFRMLWSYESTSSEILRSMSIDTYSEGSFVLASTKTSKAYKKKKVSQKKTGPRSTRAKTRTPRFGGGMPLERLASNILADMSDLAVVFDEDYTIRFLNEAAKKVYGDTVGRKCHQVIRNLDRPCHHAGIRCQIRELVEEGKDLYEDKRLAGVTGRVLHIRSRLTTTADGKKAIIGVYRDITEETKAAESLRRSEERFRIAAESASDLIWEWDIAGGRLDWFGKIDELLGYAPGEFPRTMGAYMGIVHPEDRERVAAALDRHLNGQAPYCEEYRVLRKDGAILHWIDRGTALRDEEGKLNRMIGACSDIADQKRLEESKALREQQSLLQRVLDNIPTPVFYKDTNGLYQGCNIAFARFFGLPKERLIGRSVYELWPEDLADKYYEMDSKLLKNPGIQVYETSATHTDGTRHDVIFNKATYTDADGKVAGIVAVITDITQRRQMEKQLEESLSILNATLESTADGILVISKDEKVTGYNQRYVEMFHTPESFLRSKDDRQIVAFVQEQMKDPEGFLRRTRELFDHPELEKSDLLEFTDGRIYERYSRPHRIGEKIVGRVVSFRDITQRKLAEDRLKESEEFNRSLLLNSASPVFVANPDGSIRYVSPALEAMTGYSSSELIGMNPPYPYWPEDRREEMIGRHEEHILHGIKRFEEHFQKRNGEPFWVEINSSPIKDEDGAVKYYLSIWTDITERKRMEEKLKLYSENLEKLVEDRSHELKRSEAKYRLLVNNIADAVFSIDLAGNFTFVSHPAEEITGYPIDKLLAMNMRELVVPEHLPHILERIQRFIEGERLPTYEVEIARADGKRLPAEIRTTPILNGDGKLIGIQGIARDITERKRTEEELRRIQRLAVIGETAAMVGHDLRNPLQGITTAAYALRTKLRAKMDERIRTMLEIIERDIEYANKIVSDLVEYSGEIQLKRTWTNLKSLTEDALTSARVPENIRVSTLISDELKMEVDVNKLKRVYVNLIRNAVDAMPSGGRLAITGAKYENDLEIKFTDTGAGMSDEVMKRIWEPLHTTKPRGMGFGLSICKRMIEAHRGTIYVESAVGKGTTFTIRIPIKSESTGERPNEIR